MIVRKGEAKSILLKRATSRDSVAKTDIKLVRSIRRRTVPSSPYRNHASPGYILGRHIYVHRVSHDGWTSRRASAAAGETRGCDREIDPRRDPTAWTDGSFSRSKRVAGERNVTRIDTGIVRVLQPRWIWPITWRSRFWHAFGTWTCRWFCPMYRRSPLFQRSFRIMLNNGTGAIVSAERDHVQITMIRRYREPPARTPCSLSYLRPFAWTVAFVLFRFSYLQLPIFFFPPALSFPLLLLSLFCPSIRISWKIIHLLYIETVIILAIVFPRC